MPPSLREIPGSSTIACSNNDTSSSKSSIPPSDSRKSGDTTAEIFIFNGGKAWSESFSATRSRAFAVPTSMRVRRRSKSKISLQCACTSSRREKSAANSATPSKRRSIFSEESSGYSSHLRKRRLPIAVFVKSRTSSKVSFLLPSRRLRMISKLRNV